MNDVRSAEIISGREAAAAVREGTLADIQALKARGIVPRMAAVIVGVDASVQSYVDVKRRLAEKLGITFDVVAFPAEIGQAELEAKIEALSKDPNVHGIIVELPLPPSLDTDRAIRAIDPKKDIDGMTPHNIGLVLMGDENSAILSATAQAAVALAERFGSLSGKRVAMIGKGRTAGKPLIPVLLNRHATVTVCHAATKDLAATIADCEVIFVGVGKPELLNTANVRPEQVIIDIGTTLHNGRIVGDAAPEVGHIVRALTPVPDGVGPLTTAFIFKNLLKAIALQNL